MTTTLAIPTEVSELNLLRGLVLTSTPPILVARRVSRDEARESALRLASAAVGSGPRAVISTPPKSTDDDVTVLAFIKQHVDPVSADRAKTVALTAKRWNVPDAEPFNPGAGEIDPSILAAFHDLGAELFGGHALSPTEADALKSGAMPAAAASLANTASKPRSPLPSQLTAPGNERDRLLLAASLLVQEVARLDRASVLTPG